MLWQSAYAEMVFPPFCSARISPEQLWEAIVLYAQRTQRFGGSTRPRSSASLRKTTPCPATRLSTQPATREAREATRRPPAGFAASRPAGADAPCRDRHRAPAGALVLQRQRMIPPSRSARRATDPARYLPFHSSIRLRLRMIVPAHHAGYGDRGGAARNQGRVSRAGRQQGPCIPILPLGDQAGSRVKSSNIGEELRPRHPTGP
jgi:hypothetical protein